MEPREDPSSVAIENLSLSVRSYSALKRERIDTIGQLVTLPERRLMVLGDFTPQTMDELKHKVRSLGLTAWSAPQAANRPGAATENPSAGRHAPTRRPGRGALRQEAVAGRPGRLSLCAVSLAGALLPAAERDRWVEEWKGELCALGSRAARVRFAVSLLLDGGQNLAATLRSLRQGDKPS
jgi:hypothetical protein